MDYDRGSRPPNPPPLPTLADPAPPDIHFRLLIQQYVVVACLTVSLPSALSSMISKPCDPEDMRVGLASCHS